MKRRLGTFIGITPAPAFFYIRPTGGNERHVGAHGGLSADEMQVPLIVA